MPTPVDRLTPQSDDAQSQAAITECVAFHMQTEGLSQEQAQVKCQAMASQKRQAPAIPGQGQLPPSLGGI